MEVDPENRERTSARPHLPAALAHRYSLPGPMAVHSTTRRSCCSRRRSQSEGQLQLSSRYERKYSSRPDGKIMCITPQCLLIALSGRVVGSLVQDTHEPRLKVKDENVGWKHT